LEKRAHKFNKERTDPKREKGRQSVQEKGGKSMAGESEGTEKESTLLLSERKADIRQKRGRRCSTRGVSFRSETQAERKVSTQGKGRGGTLSKGWGGGGKPKLRRFCYDQDLLGNGFRGRPRKSGKNSPGGRARGRLGKPGAGCPGEEGVGGGGRREFRNVVRSMRTTGIFWGRTVKIGGARPDFQGGGGHALLAADGSSGIRRGMKIRK